MASERVGSSRCPSPMMEAINIVLATVDQIIPDTITLQYVLRDSLPLLVRPSNQYALRARFFNRKKFLAPPGLPRGDERWKLRQKRCRVGAFFIAMRLPTPLFQKK